MGGLFFQRDVWVELLDAFMDTTAAMHKIICQQLLAVYLTRWLVQSELLFRYFVCYHPGGHSLVLVHFLRRVRLI